MEIFSGLPTGPPQSTWTVLRTIPEIYKHPQQTAHSRDVEGSTLSDLIRLKKALNG